MEVAVALSMAAIVLAYGVPAFTGMVRDNRVLAQSSRFVTALNLARSEAVKRGQRIVICKADVTVNPPECDPAICNAGTGAGCWEEGWVVFSDSNGDGVIDDDGNTTPCEASDPDCVIRVYEAMPENVTLRRGGNSARLIYNSTGAAAGSADTFRLCHGTDANKGRSIVINNTGRVRIDKGAASCP